MVWQDWVFSVGSWIFVIALIPTIRGKNKPELSTCLTTAIILSLFALCYFTLELWLSGLSTVATSACWFLLSYQKYKQNKK